jgi:Ser/Thr protein kinase RdoA (MazF antagonist)
VDPGPIAAELGLTIVRPFSQGESGRAYEVTAADGVHAVLKLYDEEPAVARTLTAALVTRGYPLPATLACGRNYELTELLPGVGIEQPLPAHVGQLVALVDLQREVGLPGREPWIEHVVSTVVDGREGYCEHEQMRARDPALLDRLRAIADRDVDVPLEDVVHYDFSPYNILADGDRITGVVDWTGATAGDAAFDLLTCAYYAYDYSVRDRLLDAARARTDVRALPLYAAHMVLRQIDWCMRFYDDLAVRFYTDLGLALLDAIGA